VKLAKITNEYASTLIKHEKFDSAETTLLKNRQIIEPIADKSPWDKKLEWQLLRVAIVSKLIFVYQKLNKPLRIYQILKNCFQNMRIDLLFESPESFEKDVESLFISMAFCCFTFKKYDEAEIYANDGIKIIRKILRNNELLDIIQEHFKQKGLNYDRFINKKNISLAKLINLLGKISEKIHDKEEAINNYYQAYNLIKIFQGENSALTLAFKNDLARFKEPSPRTLKMKSDISFPDLISPANNNNNELYFSFNSKNLIPSSNELLPIRHNSSSKNNENSSNELLPIRKNLSSKNNENSVVHAQRKKCVTLHESCHEEPKKENHKIMVKKEKIRPQSANDKLKRKDSLSEFLVKKQKGWFGENSPDMFKIKIFYPIENPLKSKRNLENFINQDNNTDSQSTRLINSIHFDKSSLKSIVKIHRKNQKTQCNSNEKEHILDSNNDSQTIRNLKYSLILTPRPPSNSRQKSLLKKKSKIQSIPIQKVENIALEIDLNAALNHSFSSSKSEKTQNQSIIPIQIKEPNEDNDGKNALTSRNKDSKVNTLLPYDSPNKMKRNSVLEKDIKLNINEINKDVSPRAHPLNSDKNAYLNKRKNLDSGAFIKQRNEFLLQTTPKKKESVFFKLENKISSQKKIISYAEHQDKILMIQRFFRNKIFSRKKSKKLSTSQIMPMRKDSSMVFNQLESKFYLKN